MPRPKLHIKAKRNNFTLSSGAQQIIDIKKNKSKFVSGAIVEKYINYNASDQDTAFRLAEMLEQAFDLRYTKSDTIQHAYEIESQIRSMLDAAGLKIIVIDIEKFRPKSTAFLNS